MVTGGFRIVLLVFCLKAAASSGIHSDPSICDRSAKDLVFNQLVDCTHGAMRRLPAMIDMENRALPPTMADVARIANDFCQIAIPEGLSCFQDKISDCNSTFQTQINELAQNGTGVLCQPGGVGINPAISAVFDGIDDELLVTQAHCPRRLLRYYTCRKQMPGLSEVRNFSLDELTTWMQKVANKYVRCSFEFHRSLKDSCPHWRSAFLMDIFYLLTMQLPGVRLSFTPEQLIPELEM